MGIGIRKHTPTKTLLNPAVTCNPRLHTSGTHSKRILYWSHNQKVLSITQHQTISLQRDKSLGMSARSDYYSLYIPSPTVKGSLIGPKIDNFRYDE